MYKPDKGLCVDESMVPFQGRVSIWQYDGSKRHRFGIKLFKLRLKSGYMQKVKVNAGKDPKKKRSVAEVVVIDLMKGFLRQGRCFCWYTSLQLAHRLLKKRTDLVGTLRRNQKGVPQVVKDRKLERGEFFYQLVQKWLHVMKWRDRTKHDACCQPCGKPTVVIDYDNMKGLVDLSNQMAAHTPYVRKTNKWYVRLFHHLVQETQTASVNAWLLYCMQVKKIKIDIFLKK
ncbi:hypothetical protein GCK32_004169 [Trichostrongylus colubriformis]|uniref:PiggyBac transposable element-derived protein domain-containing protein n=1 Tax=Trichostrongylus colubriformis TaxID=6319 RepID=A0AAN8INV4_TRICO